MASHENLLVLKDLPIGETCHYSSKNLVEVFVNRRVLVAELFCLIDQVLAQQVSFNLYSVPSKILILARVVVLAQFVLLFNLLYDTTAVLLTILTLLKATAAPGESNAGGGAPLLLLLLGGWGCLRAIEVVGTATRSFVHLRL